MARYFDVHPRDPQARSIAQVVALLQDDAVIAYPTDSCYALGSRIGNHAGADRIRKIRGLGPDHHFTLVCADFAQLGQFVHVDNKAFRAVKAATPGPYTFILEASKEVPRRLSHPSRKTIGLRVPEHTALQALLTMHDGALLGTTLIAPGDSEPMNDANEIRERFEKLIAGVIDAGACALEPTTVIDLTGTEPQLIRQGGGELARLGL